MVPLSTSVSRQRSERRIAVRLPLKVRGKDSRGFAFEEETSSENLCRSGAAFVTRFDVAVGSDLEIRIPFSQYASRRSDADFATHGRVVHVADADVPSAKNSSASNSLARGSNASSAPNPQPNKFLLRHAPRRALICAFVVAGLSYPFFFFFFAPLIAPNKSQ